MMPAHDAEAFIGEAIESVLSQTYAGWELVVVDDGSTDGTARVVAGYASDRIRLIRQSNQGEAAARNLALAEARGEFVAFLDADDVFLPNHLADAVSHLRTHPEHGGVYSDGWYVNEEGARLGTLAGRRRGPFSGRLFDELVRASDVFGPPICVVVRRRPLVEHELAFDTRITIGPDWDFLTRLADVIDFGYIDQTTCLYRLHPGSISRTAGDEIRRASLAQCRRNAIGHPGFERCAPAVRLHAFYDLLVNLLAGLPDLQNEIIEWPQWTALPPKGRARILRLMAGQSLLYRLDPRISATWYDEACRLHPSDVRNQLLARVHRLDPRLCLWLLRARRGQALGRI